MNALCPQPTVTAVDAWGRWRVFRARVVGSDNCRVVVKPGSLLKVGKRISYALPSDLERCPSGGWRSAVIWRIERGCLCLTRT